MYNVDIKRKELPLRWRNLLKEEKDILSNGCGSKAGWLSPPDFFFVASCDHHDMNYWLGGYEADRKLADLEFYHAMKIDARSAPWYIRWFHYSLALTYYTAVRTFGGKHFHYSDRERTWEDLETCMNEAI